MNRNLLNLSGKIDSLRLEAFEAIATVAEAEGVRFFVIGAASRDMLFEHVHDIKALRATQDIDFGVYVSAWAQYEKLKKGLETTGKFILTEVFHRVKYEGSLIIDLIPFGPIADRNDKISWPPKHEIEMSTLGFEESYQHSVTIRLRSDPVLDIRFASLAGLALLKIIAWDDKDSDKDKDADDLAFILRNYIDAGNDERLFSSDKDLINNQEDFDYESASARLLGRDMATISQPKTASIVLAILNRETGKQDRYRLVEDMLRNSRSHIGDLDDMLHLVEELKKGFEERL
jgi:predicted nucleotidyltransferase